MNLVDLQWLLVVAEERCVTRAAARLYLSQPALSRRMQRLERTVGSTLFVRHSRSVSLTPAGEALAEHARALLVAADAAVQSAQAAAGRTVRRRADDG